MCFTDTASICTNNQFNSRVSQSHMIISYASTAAAATAAIGQFVGNLAAIAKDITYLLLGSSANTPKQDFYSLNAATVTHHLQHAQSLNVSNVNAYSIQ